MDALAGPVPLPAQQSTIFYGTTVPPIRVNEVYRDGILSSIRDMLSNDIDVVFVEGPEGVGKTTLLAQLVRYLHPNSLSVFIRNLSRWSYDPEILLRDLTNQAALLLSKESSPGDALSTETQWRNHIFQLQREARKTQSSFYIIIDGLEPLEHKDKETKRALIEVLPVGIDGFKFIFSGPKEAYPELADISSRSKAFIVPTLGFDEACRMLSGIPLDRTELEFLHRLCKGNPGKITAVRKLLENNSDAKAVIESLPEHLPSIFEVDWKAVSALDPADLECIAILAHEHNPQTITSLAAMTKREISEIGTLIDSVPFLEVDESTSGITFSSEPARQYARRQLNYLRDRALEITIDYLLSRPDTSEALLTLPTIFRDTSRWNDLLVYLSPEHLERMIELTQSWKVARQQVQLGREAARRLQRDSDFLRLSIAESALVALDEAHGSKAEIAAYIALGQYDAALALAQSAVSHEERLHMLTVLARGQKERLGSPEPELLQEIQRLFSLLDAEQVGPRAVHIAADLLYVKQELAIDLVKASLKSQWSAHEREFALARITVEAFHATRAQGATQDALTKLTEAINDPAVKGFSSTVSVVFGELSAQEVIAAVDAMHGIETQMAVLRLWCTENYLRDDAIVVVLNAIERIVRTTDYSPNARVFREIARPISVAKKSPELTWAVERLDSQRGAAKRLGPTEEYVRFEISLALGQIQYEPEAGQSRLLDVYLSVLDVDDVALRASCLSRIYTAIFDKRKPITASAGDLGGNVKGDLEKCVHALLKSTARHFKTVKPIIRALATCDLEWALSMASMLNTRERKERALCEAVCESCVAPVTEKQLGSMLGAAASITDAELRTRSILRICEMLSESDSDRAVLLQSCLRRLQHMISGLPNLEERLRAGCLLWTKMSQHPDLFPDESRSKCREEVVQLWRQADLGWRKVICGYQITTVFAEHSGDAARRMLQEVEQSRADIQVDGPSSGDTFFNAVRLPAILLAGIATKKEDVKEMEERLLHLIGYHPSIGSRAYLIADIIVGYWAAGRQSLAKALGSSQLRPLLDQLPRADAEYRARTIVYCSAALYCTHAPQAFDLIGTLSEPWDEMALRRIIWFLLTKTRPFEPYEAGNAHDYGCEFEEIRDILEIAKKLQRDYALESVFERIVDMVTSARRKHAFSAQQRADIIQHLGSLTSRLPDPHGVQHEGYVLACSAHLMRLKDSKRLEWEALISRAKLIPNDADACYVLSVIGSAMPAKFGDIKSDVLTVAMEFALKIPTLLDRIERLELIASRCRADTPSVARECLKIAVEQSASSTDDDIGMCHRRMIDLAYRIDQEFAAQLASIADTDPAKRRKSSLREALEANQLREKILNDSIEPPKRVEDVYQLLEAAETLHGQVNAKRVAPKKFEELVRYIQVAANLPLQRALPILNWVMVNMVKKYAASEHANRFLGPMLESALLAAELAARMVTKRRREGPWVSHDTSSVASGCIIILPGQREKARSIIKSWIEREVDGPLRILDPYFGPSDLEWVLEIRALDKRGQIDIVTGRKHNVEQCGSVPFDEYYRRVWSVQISDQDPGDCTIHIVGVRETATPPFHDRYWLSGDSGLRLGTSINSLGFTKQSEVSELQALEAQLFQREIEKYLSRAVREHRGQKVDYITFSL